MQGVSLGGWPPPLVARWAWSVARTGCLGTPQLPGAMDLTTLRLHLCNPFTTGI